MIRTVFEGYGHYLPPKVVTNDDLAKLMDTSDEWITQRTGIKERRYVEGEVGSAELGKYASEMALEHAGIEAKDLDLIIFATLSPDYNFPGNAVLLQNMLGARQIASLDIRNQCSGFLYGLQVADVFLKTGEYKKVLLCGGEVHSTGLEFADRGRDVTVIFGDGAAAVVLGTAEGKGNNDDRGVLVTRVAADGVGAKELMVEAPTSIRNPRITAEMMDEGSHYPRMNGKFVFKWATDKMPEIAHEVLEETGIGIDEIDWFVPHQANLRINQMVAKRLGIPEEKCVNNIVHYGNTTAATIPLGLSELMHEGKAKQGDLVLSAAFGAGFTWGASLFRL